MERNNFPSDLIKKILPFISLIKALDDLNLNDNFWKQNIKFNSSFKTVEKLVQCCYFGLGK